MGHMQICTSPQTHEYATIPPFSFYRPDTVFVKCTKYKKSLCAVVSTVTKCNKCIFSFCLRTGNVRSGHHSSGGRLFHNQGPLTMELLSPNRLCVHGTENIRMSLEPECSGQWTTSDSWQQSSVRYTGAMPASDWWTNNPTVLKGLSLSLYDY